MADLVRWDGLERDAPQLAEAGHHLLYQYGPTTTFEWRQQSNVTSSDDVVNLLRSQSGCRWVAIEISRNEGLALGQRLLREAVKRSEFEWVRSFPITGAGDRRVSRNLAVISIR